MGVKSTEYISREAAIDKAVDLYAEINRRKISAQFVVMSDAELENELERMNDEAHGGEGFANYIIE